MMRRKRIGRRRVGMRGRREENKEEDEEPES
jgi:hypothetical protein